jgi:hypothetical protein
MLKVSREDIASVLVKWGRGEMSDKEVMDWAGYWIGQGFPCDDWEEDNSVCLELIYQLDSLDMNLMLPEDIPIHLEFLGTPPGEFDRGHERWRFAMAGIDFKTRARQLRNNPLYRPFCG